MHRLKAGASAFEDGTPDFLSLPALCQGIEWFRSLDVEQVSCRVRCLTTRFLSGMARMGESAVVYGPASSGNRGGTVAFNLRSGQGVIPAEQVKTAARACGIALRGGCFCNPGAAERALGIPPRRARRCLDKPGFTIPNFRQCLGGVPVGALRASFGPANNFEDIDRLLQFLAETARLQP